MDLNHYIIIIKKDNSIIIRVEGPENCSIKLKKEYHGEYTNIKLVVEKK